MVNYFLKCFLLIEGWKQISFLICFHRAPTFTLQPLYNRIKSSFGDETKPCLLLIDELTVLLSIGVHVQQIANFIHYCAVLMCHSPTVVCNVTKYHFKIFESCVWKHWSTLVKWILYEFKNFSLLRFSFFKLFTPKILLIFSLLSVVQLLWCQFREFVSGSDNNTLINIFISFFSVVCLDIVSWYCGHLWARVKGLTNG